MNSSESRRLYTGVELHRPVECSEMRDQTFAHRGGHLVRLMFFSTAAYRKIRCMDLGSAAIPDLDSRSVERGRGNRTTRQTRKCHFKHLLQGLPAPPMPRPHSTLRTSGNGLQARSATRLKPGELAAGRLKHCAAKGRLGGTTTGATTLQSPPSSSRFPTPPGQSAFGRGAQHEIEVRIPHL